jgi:AraC-like DNA-binding protein
MHTAQPVGPVDLGCGTLLPMRWSSLCAVYKYDHDGLHRPNLVEDKPFEMHVLVQTTRGRWDFHGHRGVEQVDSGLLVAGFKGDRYGCRHNQRSEDSNIIASLRASALDEDDAPLFVRQTLPIDAARCLDRAIAAGSQDEFDSRVFELFDFVSTQSLRETQPRRTSRLRMQRVKRFIEDHAFEEISLVDIAACAGLSAFVCLRLFKASVGITPHAYLNYLRVRRARELLKEASLAIGTVGFRVGVRDRCYFARWFKKETGMSPSEFREACS